MIYGDWDSILSEGRKQDPKLFNAAQGPFEIFAVPVDTSTKPSLLVGVKVQQVRESKMKTRQTSLAINCGHVVRGVAFEVI